MARSKIWALVVALLTAGCGGGSSSLPATQPVSTAAPTAAQFTITIPPKIAQGTARNPKYISASTESVIITLVSVNGNAYTSTATAPASLATNLTPSSPNCAPSGGNLVCTAGATAVAGSDQYSIATYDATQTTTSPATPAGTLLSQGTTTLTVTAGQTTSGVLVLTGVAASAIVTLATPDPHASIAPSGDIVIVGNQPRTFTVTPVDPDSNLISGPGTPTYTVTSGSGAVAIASTATAGTFTAQVTSYSVTPVQITLTPSSGAAVSFNIDTVQELWVANSGNNTVTGYNGSTGVQLTGDTINGTAGLSAPFMIQTGPNGDLWISNQAANSIEEVVPETNTAVLTIAGGSTGISGPFGISFDSGGNLYLDSGPANRLAKFTASSFAGLSGTQNIAPAATTTTNLSNPVQNAFDSSGVLWIANNAGGPNTQVAAYDASLTNVAVIGGANTQLNGPTGVCFDSGGHLWVVDNTASTVSEFSTAGITLVNGNIAPLTTIAGGATGMNSPVGCGFDAAGNLWVGNQNVNKVLEFAAGSIAAGGNLAPAATITTATAAHPTGLTFTP